MNRLLIGVVFSSLALVGCEPKQIVFEPKLSLEQMVKAAPQFEWNEPVPADGGGIRAIWDATARFSDGVGAEKMVYQSPQTIATLGEYQERYWTPDMAKLVRERGDRYLSDMDAALKLEFYIHKPGRSTGLQSMKEGAGLLRVVALERLERGDLEGAYRATELVWRVSQKLLENVEQAIYLMTADAVHSYWFSLMADLVEAGWLDDRAVDLYKEHQANPDALRRARIAAGREILNHVAVALPDQEGIFALGSYDFRHEEPLVFAIRQSGHPLDRLKTAKLIGEVFDGTLDPRPLTAQLDELDPEDEASYSRGVSDLVKKTENPMGALAARKFYEYLVMLDHYAKGIQVKQDVVTLGLRCLERERMNGELPESLAEFGADSKLIAYDRENRRIWGATRKGEWTVGAWDAKERPLRFQLPNRKK